MTSDRGKWHLEWEVQIQNPVETIEAKDGEFSYLLKGANGVVPINQFLRQQK